MKLNKSKLQTGFTIIEVMIVLAIAGLIMVIVFLAVPALQRSQRNTSRKSILARIKTEIDNYSSNNNGLIPVSGTLAGFNTRYLPSGSNINDPSSGAVMNPVFNAALAAPAVGTVYYSDTAKCNGELPTAIASGGARNYALWTTLEGGGGVGYCLDNQ